MMDNHIYDTLIPEIYIITNKIQNKMLRSFLNWAPDL